LLIAREAAHSGHRHIEDDQRDLPLPLSIDLQRFGTVRGQEHLIAIAREDERGDAPHGWFIVHEKDLRASALRPC